MADEVKTFPEIDVTDKAMLRVPIWCIPLVVDALRQAGCEAEASDVEAFTKDYTDPEANAERLEWIAKATELVKDGEIEVDLDSTISHSEGGQYVLAWLWVDGPNVEDEKEDTPWEVVADEVESKMAAAIEEACLEAKHVEVCVEYAAYKSDENDVPIYNLNDVAVKGRALFILEGDEGTDYVSPALVDATYLQLAVLANAAMLKLDLQDHCFFEGVEIVKKLPLCVRHATVPVYRLVMGS